eukprot:GFKZ01013805.1.p1 GENE.GFKZ01013805.1~~GFKZ01013805.1.p1  ORF type:complete len:561 (+),score=65.20 GFKZ01013805.1:318-2000(+)
MAFTKHVSPCPLTPRRILGRRKRPTLITDLPDELLTKIIYIVLDTRPPGHISQRAISRFRHHGLTLSLLSRRFHALVRSSIVAVSTEPGSDLWARAMVVFARHSLSTLHVARVSPVSTPGISALGMGRAAIACPASVPSLCMLVADARPPLRELSLSDFGGAPFEHVVAMLRALPMLVEIDVHCPRPMDVAAVGRACNGLKRLSLGAVADMRDVDEMRKQFVNFVCSPAAETLVTLTIPWSCATFDAFEKIGRNCVELERFGAEFGAMHWIKHRAFKARAPLEVDFRACAREQRALFRGMLKAVSGGQLKSFAVRTMDRMPPVDLDLVFKSLEGLQDLDMLIGATTRPVSFSPKSFDLLKGNMSQSLRRLNIVGVSFHGEQVVELATEFPKLTSLSIWMAEDQKPPVEVFEILGKRIRHMSILCEWTEEMCQAVGRYNTRLESLFLVTKELSLSAITAAVEGVSNSLKEFRLFINRNNEVVAVNGNAHDGREAEEELAAISARVNNAAKTVAKICAANLEVLNISASASGKRFVNCLDIAPKLRKIAQQLWQICDVETVD